MPTALAQDVPANIPNVELSGGSLSGRYWDRSYNEVSEIAGTQKKVALGGSWYQIAGRYKNYGLDVSGRNFRPKDLDYWKARNEIDVSLRYYFTKFPWVTPILGFHSVSQSGNKDALAAPPAFLDKDQSFLMGLRTSFVPFTTSGGHGMIVQGQISYLTTLEKKSNFGNQGEFKVGYVFTRGLLRLGVIGGQMRGFSNSTVPDKKVTDKYLHVRHTQITNSYGLFIQY